MKESASQAREGEVILMSARQGRKKKDDEGNGSAVQSETIRDDPESSVLKRGENISVAAPSMGVGVESHKGVLEILEAELNNNYAAPRIDTIAREESIAGHSQNEQGEQHHSEADRTINIGGGIPSNIECETEVFHSTFDLGDDSPRVIYSKDDASGSESSGDSWDKCEE